MTTVRIFNNNIESFFERQAMRGTALPGVGRSAERLANVMERNAIRNATGEVLQERTGEVGRSVVKIVRPDPRTGAIEVGVGTTSQVGGHLENGTSPHPITPTTGVKFLVSGGPRGKGPNPNPLHGRRRRVNHPGNPPLRWLRKAVDDALIRGI
jgi:hypothetical protein